MRLYEDQPSPLLPRHSRGGQPPESYSYSLSSRRRRNHRPHILEASTSFHSLRKGTSFASPPKAAVSGSTQFLSNGSQPEILISRASSPYRNHRGGGPPVAGAATSRAVAGLRNDRVSSMSYPIPGGRAPSYVGAWTPDQESVVSGFTDASIYASLQRQPNHHRHRQQQQLQQQQQQQYQAGNHHQQQQQQHTYQRLQHPRAKPTYVSLRGVNASRPTTLKRQQR